MGLRAVMISRSGCAKRASTCWDCWETGVRARFLVGRLEMREEEVEMEFGAGADIVATRWCETWVEVFDEGGC